MKFIASCFTLFLGLLIASTAALAADISLVPAGDGRYSLNGAMMDGVAGIKVTILYDSSSLSGPAVIQGTLVSGAMLTPNTNNAGRVVVALVRTTPFSGSGQILALNFAAKTGPGGISAVTVDQIIDINGKPLPVAVHFIPESSSAGNAQTTANTPFVNPFTTLTGGRDQNSQPSADPNPQTATTTTGTTAPTGVAPSIGTITLPGESRQTDQPKSQEQPVKESPPQEQYQPPPARTTASAEETRPPETPPKKEKKITDIVKVSYSSILDRFMAFKGERKMTLFVELFTKPVAGEARQEPAISVSDGNQSVRIVAGFPSAEDDSAPNFATSEAKVLSLKPEENSGRWVIELVPAKGAMTASVSILTGSRLFEIPLVTVPPAGNLNFSAAEIAAFLKDFAAEKPAFDLNNDGRHDYIDDYIYTGHYLLSSPGSREPKPK